jgi:uncharacterized protein (TIGR02270 family)
MVERHGEEAAFLWYLRDLAVRDPHYTPKDLQRLDDRLHAHVDGLRVAGQPALMLCVQLPTSMDRGRLFAPMVLALEAKERERIDQLCGLALKSQVAQRSAISALGWTSAQFLQGTIKELLSSTSAFRQLIGLACCAMHRVDPGVSLGTLILDSHEPLRAKALRSAGELGRRDLLPACQYALQDKDDTARFWASWSAVLLGDRDKAVRALTTFASAPGPLRGRALQLSLRAMHIQGAHDFLKPLAADPKNIRILIQGAGIVGDPYYVPWLIKQMDDLKLTRLAGESFSFITGLDLAYLDLERKPPENFESGPNDDPNDENVEMDADDGLPWPDPVKIQKWWDANKLKFQNGSRYFMGQPVTVEHCKQVLKDGYQRQRIAAAQYLCLLQPGTVLFPTSAPAWRQKRLLERL